MNEFEYKKFGKESNCNGDDIDPIIYMFLKKSSLFRVGKTLRIENHFSTRPFAKPTKLQMKFIHWMNSKKVSPI